VAVSSGSEPTLAGEWVDDDCVGGVKDDLVCRLEKHDDPDDYRQRGLDEPYYTINYDFVLVPAREEVLF
jgi:hypothetical protein